MVLVTLLNFKTQASRFMVLDIDKKESEVNFEHVLTVPNLQDLGTEAKRHRFTGIASRRGVPYFYDLEGYLEELVESKRYVK